MPRKNALAALLLVVPLTAGTAWAQRPLPQALAEPQVAAALAAVDARRDNTARWLAAIGGIVSPSGQERERAEAVAAEMRRIGLADVTVDAAPNVVGRIRGRSGKALVFVSTLDDLATVAAHQRATTAKPRIDGDRVVGPGTNTSTTTAALVAAADALLKSGIVPEHDLVFAAVAQEETGLVGMGALYAQWRDRALAFVDVLGDGHSITYGAITIHWWKVVATGPGGQVPGLRESALVTTAEAIARHLGYAAQLGNAGSANLNVPLGKGSVAIGIGGNRGGQRGFPDEWGDIPQMMRTAKFVVLLAATIGR